MARKQGTIKSFIELWGNHEELYISIFTEALEQIEITEKQSLNENIISEALCPILNQISFQKKAKTPDWEKPIQPILENELKGGKKNKRPDFTCSLVNKFADCQEMHEISFQIECKKLGENKGTWNLNKNYVNDGILRFDSKEHEYGKRALSGMMVGYMIDMTPDKILDDVNNNISGNLSKLKFLFTKKVVSFEQQLTRNNIEPKKFKIIHNWVDLRKFK